MNNILVLKPPIEVELYYQLTYPSYHKLLDEIINPDSQIIAIACYVNDQAIGLGLAQYYTADQTNNNKGLGIIYSIFVKPEYRTQGYGTKIWIKMEEEMRSYGCQKIWLDYVESEKTKGLEKILDNRGYSDRLLTGLIFYSSKLTPESRPELYALCRKFILTKPDDYILFSWDTLTPSDREFIISKQKVDPLYLKFNPLVQEDKIEYSSSFGLRYHEEVIGWVITHRIGDDTLRYSLMFIDPRFPSYRGLPIIGKAVMEHMNHPKFTKFVFRVDPDNTMMLKFLKQKMNFSIDRISKSWQVSQLFN